MKKYIKISERNSKDNSVIQHFLFSVDEIEYVNVRFNNLDKDRKDYHHIELIVRGLAPMRVCKNTDRDTVEWEFDYFSKWLTDENAKFAIYDFDVCDD